MYALSGCTTWGGLLLKSRTNQGFVSRGGVAARGAPDATPAGTPGAAAPDAVSFAAARRGASTTVPAETTATEGIALGEDRCLAAVPVARGRVLLAGPSMTFLTVDEAPLGEAGATARFGSEAGGSANAGSSATVGELASNSIFFGACAKYPTVARQVERTLDVSPEARAAAMATTTTIAPIAAAMRPFGSTRTSVGAAAGTVWRPRTDRPASASANSVAVPKRLDIAALSAFRSAAFTYIGTPLRSGASGRIPSGSSTR